MTINPQDEVRDETKIIPLTADELKILNDARKICENKSPTTADTLTDMLDTSFLDVPQEDPRMRIITETIRTTTWLTDPARDANAERIAEDIMAAFAEYQKAMAAKIGKQ